MKNIKAANTANSSTVLKNVANTEQVTRSKQFPANTALPQKVALVIDKNPPRKLKREDDEEDPKIEEPQVDRAHGNPENATVAGSSGAQHFSESPPTTLIASAGSATDSLASTSAPPSSSPPLTTLSFTQAIAVNTMSMSLLKTVAAIAATALVVRELSRDNQNASQAVDGDTLPPQLVSINGNASQQSITLTFSEAIKPDQTATASAFIISQGGTVLHPSSITVSNSTVILNGITGLQSGPFTLKYNDTPGDGTAQLQDIEGNDVASFMQGIVADGYIRGASIYIDTDNDGIADANEFTGIITRDDGSFVLPQLNTTGAIIAVGGINNDTNVPNTMALTGPLGALVINPLTTLVQQVARDMTPSGGVITPEAIATANAQVRLALGLPQNLDISTFDPLGSAANSSAENAEVRLAVQKAAAQVATIIMLASDDSAVQAELIASMASSLSAAATANTPVDLSASAFLEDLLSEVITTEQFLDLIPALGAIKYSSNLADIAQSQSSALNSTAPNGPTVELATASDSGRDNTDKVTSDNTPTLRGTGLAGDNITVSRLGTDETWTTTVANNGSWTVTPSQALNDGTHTFSVTATDRAGQTGPATLLSLILDRGAPASPSVNLAATSDTGSSKTDDITSDTTPTLSGTGVARDLITVTLPSTGEVLTTTVASNGSWSVTPTKALGNGTSQVSVTATDRAGNTSDPTLLSITIDKTAPSLPTADVAANSDTGSNTADDITSDDTPTFRGTGTAGDTITVTIPGTREVLTTTVAEDGNWSVTPTKSIADGRVNVSVTATDKAGNTSASTVVQVLVDATAPAQPTAQVVTASDTGRSKTDNITSDNTPTLSGKGVAGDTITVTLPGTGEVKTTTVDSNGDWSITPAQALADGPHTIGITATDKAGHTSSPKSLNVVIDTTAPTTLTAALTSPLNTSDNTPTLNGTGTAGDTITVTVPGTGEVLTTRVDSQGNWSATPNNAMANGTANVSVKATDLAGNTSEPTVVEVTITDPVGPRLAVGAPQLLQILPGGVGIPPQLTFKLDVDGAVGGVVTTGDVLTVTFGQTSFTKTLTTADIDQGKASVIIDPSLLNQPFSARISDAKGYLSPIFERVDDPYTINLSEQLSSTIMMLLEGASNVELPGIGSIEKLVAPIAQAIMDMMADLPSLKRVSTAATQSIQVDAFMGFDGAQPDDAQTLLQPMMLASASLETQSETDDYSWILEPVNEDENNDSSEFDWILDPNYNPTPDEPEPIPDGSEPIIPEEIPQEEFDLKAWIKEHLDFTGSEGRYDATQGMGNIRLKITMHDVLQPFSGNIGGESMNLSIDGNLNLDALLDFNLKFETVDKPVSKDGQTITRSYLAIDTEASGLEMNFAGSFTPGNQVSGTLGPLSLTLKDQESERVPSSATLKNTAIKASLDFGLVDNDADKTDKRHTLDGDTVLKFFNDVADPLNFDASEWLTFKAALEGQISGEAELMLDVSNMVDGLGNPTVDAVAQFLRMNLTADLTVPLSLEYDSTKDSIQDYGRIYLDNVSTGIKPLVNDKLGPAVELMDNYLGWLFDFKNLMYQAAPIPASLTTPLAPIDLPGWLSAVLPGSTDDPNSLEYDINALVNQPSVLINQAMASIIDKLDENNDSTISNLESIKGVVTFLYLATTELSNAWDQVSSIPGLRASLTSSGYGAIPVAILDGIGAVKPTLEKTLQSILILEDVLKAVDSLEQVSSSYHALQDGMSADSAMAGLQVDLGSHVFDFKTGSIQSLDRGFYTNVLDYLYPLPANPEPGLDYEVAIARILAAADTNTANAENLHVHVFLAAQIEGVTSQNVAAMRDMLNSGAINSARLKLNAKGETVRNTDDPGSTTDGKTAHDGIQDEVNAYLQILNMASGNPAFLPNWESLDSQALFKAKLLDAFKTLGVVAADFKPTADADYYYTDSEAMEFAIELVTAQNYAGVDTMAEVSRLWQIKNQLIDLADNRDKIWVNQPGPPPVRKPTPPIEITDLASINLHLIEKDESKQKIIIDDINTMLDDIRFAGAIHYKLESKVDEWNKITLANGTENLSSEWALGKLRDAAKKNTAEEQGLTELNFSMAGVKGLSQAILPLVLQVMDQGAKNMDNWSTANFQKLVDAANVVYTTVNGKPASNTDLIAALVELFEDPGVNSSLADPFVFMSTNAGGAKLLSEVLVNRAWSEVDSLIELEQVIDVVSKITWLTWTEPDLYKNLSKQPAFTQKSASEISAIINARVGYGENLSAEDLKLIGFTKISNSQAVTDIETALKNYLLVTEGAGTDGLPTIKTPISYRDLRMLVDNSTSTGWFADILSNPDAEPFLEVWNSMHDAGFDFPILSDQDAFGNLFNWLFLTDEALQVSDIMTFTPQLLPSLTLDKPIALSYDFLKDIPGLSLETSLNVDMGVVPRISMGIDTLGIASFARAFATGDWDSDVFAAIPNSFYLADTHMNNGSLQDLPELEAWIDIFGMVEFMIGSRGGLINAFANAKAGLNFDFTVDLEDPDGDGKARMLDLINQGLDGGFGNMFDIDLMIEAMLGIGAGIDFDFSPADGLPKDWSPATKAAIQTAVGIYEYFGGPSEFEIGFDKEWLFPIYNSKTGESVFIA
jgi:hypothetical protein